MLRLRESAGCTWSRLSITHCVMLLTIVLAAFSTLSRNVCGEESSRVPATKPDSLQESSRTIQSGPEAGSTIRQFFVRAVTGPHRNRSVCYVCRYGNRPVVMILIQDLDPKIATLLKTIDAIVDDNRVTGLRSFGVLVTDESDRAVPTLQTMAFDERIQMPLTAATTTITGPGCHNLHEDAATTVILYRDQQAVQNFAFEKDSINDESIASLVQSVKKLIEPAKSE